MKDTVLLLQHNRTIASRLAVTLREYFDVVVTADSVEQLREAAARSRAKAAVVDLEVVDFDKVAELHSSLDLCIVCTHRVADEGMWTRAIEAGALDCCYDDDEDAVCRAFSRKAAAAA